MCRDRFPAFDYGYSTMEGYINFISKMQNLTISNFFGAPEFCFDAKLGVVIFWRDGDFPWQGESKFQQKIATPNFASKQNSGAPKKSQIIKFCIFVWKS